MGPLGPERFVGPVRNIEDGSKPMIIERDPSIDDMIDIFSRPRFFSGGLIQTGIFVKLWLNIKSMFEIVLKNRRKSSNECFRKSLIFKLSPKCIFRPFFIAKMSKCSLHFLPNKPFFPSTTFNVLKHFSSSLTQSQTGS